VQGDFQLATAPWASPAEEVVAALGSDAQRGLGSDEARRRLERVGRNELPESAPPSALRRLLAQFRDPLVLLLLAATAISLVLWLAERSTPLPYEAIAILSVVLINALIGFLQQSRAEQALAALRRMSAARAQVVRDGERRSVPAAELVPGDVLLVEEGDTIPADARLVRCAALRTAEAALTGESLPVAKQVEPVAEDAALGDRANMIWSGTAATYGRGRAVVTATGPRTEMGRIAGLLEATPDEATPLQRELARVGRLLGLAVIAIAVVIVATIVLLGQVRDLAGFFDVLILGVALAVAAVPEGLPAVVTAVLAIGVQRMARRNALVRHLTAVEALGSANVIASDKTGTLTRNEMTVRAVVTASGRVHLGGTGYAPEGEVRTADGGPVEGPLRQELERALAVGDRASNATLQQHDGHWVVMGDPTEGALLVAARKAGLDGGALDARFQRVGEVPFSSERKLMSTIHRDAQRKEQLRIFTKGAADVLLARCTHVLVGDRTEPLDERRRAAFTAAGEELARDALRTLGVAFRSLPADALDPEAAGESVEHDLVFAGLIGMMDPPRAEVPEAVARTRTAGIRPLMITGDHPATAAAIAAELGIAARDARVVTGPELTRMSDEELERAVREASVYARVAPDHKLRIVQALQRQGAVVAMTGDGVNDAPALRSADIGVAMGLVGTDVARQAADIVLADDNYATIVAAVEEGRAIFANIRKFLRYLLATNVGEVLTMFAGVMLANVLGLAAVSGDGLVLPLLATQILWINLVTDGAPALALGVDPPDPDLMHRAPRPTAEGVITPRMWLEILGVGALMAVGTLGVLDAGLPGGLIEGSGTLAHAQTMAFTTLVLFQLMAVFEVRSEERSAFAGLFANRWLWGAVLLALALQLAVTRVPFLQHAFSTEALSAGDWLRCTAVASSVVWVREAVKLGLWLRRRAQRTREGARPAA
jgi:Ca2+-transporting ATPase